MITFIIPTLWKSDKIHETIKRFQDIKDPNLELIIIDNTNSLYKNADDRIIIVKPESNIFVNPSWNLGVSMAKNKYVCILNDDITLNINTLLNNFERLVTTDPNFGIIGLHSYSILMRSVNENHDLLEIFELDHRIMAFGCMMILKKDNYIQIPEVFKVYFGDDYLYYYNKTICNRKNYAIDGLKTPGEISATSVEFEHHTQQEYAHWNSEINKLAKKYKNNLNKNEIIKE